MTEKYEPTRQERGKRQLRRVKSEGWLISVKGKKGKGMSMGLLCRMQAVEGER